MSVQDILTITPTLVVMSLFAFYRDEVLCLWGCNPTIQSLMDSGKMRVQVGKASIQRYSEIIMSHATDWYSSVSDVSKQAIAQWAQKSILRVQEIDYRIFTLCLYITYIVAFAIVIYFRLHTEAQRAQVFEGSLVMKPETTNEVAEEKRTVARRPITRSITNGNLKENVY